jgi:hypothetical protein
MTCIAGHVVGNGHPVARSKGLYVFSYFDYFSGHFVTQYQGGLVEPIPLHAVTAAEPARLDADKDFARADLRNRHLFHTHVPIVVPHGYSHRVSP